MPSTREQAYIEIGISAVPVATTAISLFIEAEAVPAFFVIAGAVGAGLSLAAAPALVVAAVALAMADEKTVSEITASVELVGKMTDPGFVFSVPIGMVATPQDPTLFASAVGPGLDIAVGVTTPSGFDQFQAVQQAFIGFGTWASDIQKYAATFSAPKPSASSGQSGPSRESGGYSPSIDLSIDSPAWGDFNGGGFAYDSALPGGNETPEFSGSSAAPEPSWENDLQPDVTIGGEFGAENAARAEAEAQSYAAEPSPYPEQESQAAEDAAAAAEKESENDNDDGNDGGDEDGGEDAD